MPPQLRRVFCFRDIPPSAPHRTGLRDRKKQVRRPLALFASLSLTECSFLQLCSSACQPARKKSNPSLMNDSVNVHRATRSASRPSRKPPCAGSAIQTLGERDPLIPSRVAQCGKIRPISTPSPSTPPSTEPGQKRGLATRARATIVQEGRAGSRVASTLSSSQKSINSSRNRPMCRSAGTLTVIVIENIGVPVWAAG